MPASQKGSEDLRTPPRSQCGTGSKTSRTRRRRSLPAGHTHHDSDSEVCTGSPNRSRVRHVTERCEGLPAPAKRKRDRESNSLSHCSNRWLVQVHVLNAARWLSVRRPLPDANPEPLL